MKSKPATPESKMIRTGLRSVSRRINAAPIAIKAVEFECTADSVMNIKAADNAPEAMRRSALPSEGRQRHLLNQSQEWAAARITAMLGVKSASMAISAPTKAHCCP